jgi:hypothetical protein
MLQHSYESLTSFPIRQPVRGDVVDVKVVTLRAIGGQQELLCSLLVPQMYLVVGNEETVSCR